MENGLSEITKPKEALYDCYYDAHETNNLIDCKELQPIVEEMRKKLYDQMAETKDPLLEGELPVRPNYKVNRVECLQASSKNPDDYDPRGRH